MRTTDEHRVKPAASKAAGASSLFTVPPGQPFLDCLATAILAGDLPVPGGHKPDPLELPDITLYMPTRRAARGLQEAFLRAADGRALLLPRIRAIAEPQDEIGLSMSLAADDGLLGIDHEIPPPVGDLERRLVLTELVLRWSEAMRRAHGEDDDLEPYAAAGSSTPAQAAHLAAELARLMDLVETEGASLSGLADLVPETMTEHWQKTIEFLQIITAFWPEYLAERKLTSPMDHRNRAILAEAERITSKPPAGPVIVAGVTGSVPATARLMQAVAALPNGAVVLPALDLTLDDASWDAIAPDHPEHPQFGLKRLIDTLGVPRGSVRPLAGATTSRQQSRREAFVAEAMRPTSTTERWHAFIEQTRRDPGKDWLADVSLIEAAGAEEEAESISLILRHAAETPDLTAALVSPDRLLARRVAIRLKTWGIEIDDSAGRPLIKTTQGAFLDLIVEAVAADFAPAPLVALLKHPLTLLGLAPGDVRRAARNLEVVAFRTLYLGRGLDGVAAALKRARADSSFGGRRSQAAGRVRDQDLIHADDLIARLKQAFAPLVDIFARPGKHPLQALAKAHVAVAEALAKPAAEDGKETPQTLWQDEAGETAFQFFGNLLADGLPAPEIDPADYPDLYRSLVADVLVRPRVPVHPRLSIWGPFEARLQHADVMILGSLNDATWPASADPGPWLNRPMRATLGLPSPEEKIGHAAHDFTSFLGASRVYLTRAQKVDGVPTVPSRWLMRIRALLDGLGGADALKPAEPWIGWARMRDHVAERRAIKAPAPCPPVELRPRKLSVSRIEAWLANPYSIFARDILRLEPLPPLGEEPTASLRGSIVHEALSRFATQYPAALPSDIKSALLHHAKDVLTDVAGSARVAAFWLPRLERFAEWFAETEPARRTGVSKIIAEASGKLVLDAPAGPFTLTARADRMDVTNAGLVIIDYKTGVLPNDKRVDLGAAPQLPLEAAIALAQGFENVPAAHIAALKYIRASGGEPPGEERTVKSDDLDALAAKTRDGLSRQIARFDNQATPYASQTRVEFANAYDDYAHLARVAEWSALTAGEEG